MWEQAREVSRDLLAHRTTGRFWELLGELGITLLVTREYEHLAVALSVDSSRPKATFMSLPHPSGLAFDRHRGEVRIASTRNPNQVYDLVPARAEGRPLVPIRSRFYPGRLYLHDLAIVGDQLLGNAVGENAVVHLDDRGGHQRVWWPRCIETDLGPAFDRNYIQLNSIAAGETIQSSFFSASSDEISSRRPGHLNYVVDRHGVIIEGRSREVIARGLTRPHSARLFGGRLWVDNSGYGEVGTVEAGRFMPVTKLNGWTRGLCFAGNTAFVGTSRVIPRYVAYAPGVNERASVCGVQAMDIRSGLIVGGISWPNGNQVFAIEAIPNGFSTGLPFTSSRRPSEAERQLFYAFET